MPVRHSRPTAAASVLIVGLLASASAGIVGAGPALAAAFTPANLVVVRVGDGSAAPNGTAASVFLDEYTPAGALVQSVPMPTSAAGSNRPLTMSNSASSEGALALSADGRYLTLAGYSATPGTSSVVGTTSSATPRVVGRVAGDGTIDTSTAITDAFSANNVRGAVTDDGSQFWAVGAANGVRLAPLGTTGTTTSISTTATNLRTASIAGGQLYVTTGAGTQGVYAVGMGTPTTGPATAVLVAGASNDYAAVFLDRSAAVVGVDSLYVAIDSGGSAGVLKFSFDGTTWTARGGFTTPGAVRGLTGAVVGGTAELFATTAAGSGSIVKVTDTAAFNAAIAATSTTLVTAGSNTALRGIAFAAAVVGGKRADDHRGAGGLDDRLRRHGHPVGDRHWHRSAELPVVRRSGRRHQRTHRWRHVVALHHASADRHDHLLGAGDERRGRGRQPYRDDHGQRGREHRPDDLADARTGAGADDRRPIQPARATNRGRRRRREPGERPRHRRDQRQ